MDRRFGPSATLALVLLSVIMGAFPLCASAADRFDGQYFRGEGDVEYLQLLDTAYRMFYPDPEFQNISMLYSPVWNGFVEGPTWGAWWIQNSYGPTYCALPFFLEPYTTFLQNSQDLWFSQMGDGHHKGDRGLVAPDGCLCDAAMPGNIIYKQGDGKVDIHDWGMEFTAAGVVMQAELLLISRDKDAIGHYLPLLERSANFIETRRDPKNDLFLVGPAGNLLAPSYAACKRPDGTYGMAYLAGLSVTYIAALDRVIELEKMAGNADKASLYAGRRDAAKKGLAALATEDGYFVKYMEPDGTKHGVYDAEKHGYFEAVCNHDAIAFRVADDVQARKIYDKIASIPGLRPHDVIITNCPGLDDTYADTGDWLWSFGTWVNGGHWTTCEARMMLGYYRLGQYEDARRSMKHIMEFARIFRMDNNLTDFGAKVYQPKQPINVVYDTWGAPAALIRGLFEYLYTAEGVKLIPHIPTSVTELEQRIPIRFGTKRLYVSTEGAGPVSAVLVNGKAWAGFDKESVSLPYDETPDTAVVQIMLGGAQAKLMPEPPAHEKLNVAPAGDPSWKVPEFASIAGNTLPLRIGADSEGANRFIGEIRRVRIFGRALDDAEVAQLASGPDASPKDDASLVCDYLLDKDDDGSFANRAQGELTAKQSGSVKAVKTDLGKAAQFGGDGFLEVANSPALALKEAYTLDAWICPGKLPESGARIIDKLKAGLDNGYLLDTAPGNSLRLITEQGTLSYGAKLVPGKWVHVAGTFDAAGELRLYVDGRRVASAPARKSTSLHSFEKIGAFYAALQSAGLEQTYEAQHAKLIVQYLPALHAREILRKEGKLTPLPEASQMAADRSYIEAATRLAEGLAKVLQSYEQSTDAGKKEIFVLWKRCPDNP